jgi:hypothetical protein
VKQHLLLSVRTGLPSNDAGDADCPAENLGFLASCFLARAQHSIGELPISFPILLLIRSISWNLPHGCVAVILRQKQLPSSSSIRVRRLRCTLFLQSIVVLSYAGVMSSHEMVRSTFQVIVMFKRLSRANLLQEAVKQILFTMLPPIFQPHVTDEILKFFTAKQYLDISSFQGIQPKDLVELPAKDGLKRSIVNTFAAGKMLMFRAGARAMCPGCRSSMVNKVEDHESQENKVEDHDSKIISIHCLELQPNMYCGDGLW